MTSSRVADPALAARVSESELAWLRHIMPITEGYGATVRRREYGGVRVAC